MTPASWLVLDESIYMKQFIALGHVEPSSRNSDTVRGRREYGIRTSEWFCASSNALQILARANTLRILQVLEDVDEISLEVFYAALGHKAEDGGRPVWSRVELVSDTVDCRGGDGRASG